MAVAGIMAAGLSGCARREAVAPPAAPAPAKGRREPLAYRLNILAAARLNTAYRRVVVTEPRMQVALMSIPPGGDVGEEQHERVEQILFCAEGSGHALINGVKIPFNAGDMVFVTPRARHNFVNDGATPLKIYTIYAPPNHIPGRVQQTKADAEADVEDEEFGRRVK